MNPNVLYGTNIVSQQSDGIYERINERYDVPMDVTTSFNSGQMNAPVDGDNTLTYEDMVTPPRYENTVITTVPSYENTVPAVPDDDNAEDYENAPDYELL
jgi:hypothetical protein